MFVWIVFSIALIVLYSIFNNKVDTLNKKISELQEEIKSVAERVNAVESDFQENNPTLLDQNEPFESNFGPNGSANEYESLDGAPDSLTSDTTETTTVAANTLASTLSNDALNNTPNSTTQIASETYQPSIKPSAKNNPKNQSIQDDVAKSTATQKSLSEPDEQSTAIVTSVMQSLKNWFFGGNLVVRVGAIVLLMGVVLLLRLVSDYVEIPITVKLTAIAFIGLAIAGLGLKLAKKRFTYGMTLQGAGLAIAYLVTFFAYQVYEVLPGLPSFVILGTLSAVTVLLAVRQNAFPLALLAFSGAFLAPILTSSNTGSLTTLFGYYLLLNVAIAIIAHYRTWKVLNLLAATVTFGFAYYLGLIDIINGLDGFNALRWQLVLIVALHWLLYVFVVIRYTQQLLKYNEQIAKTHYSDDLTHSSNLTSPANAITTASSANQSNTDNPSTPNSQPTTSLSNSRLSGLRSYKDSNTAFIIPVDISLMFGVPLLAFGLFSVLLKDIDNALTITSALMSASYLALGTLFLIKDRKDEVPLSHETSHTDKTSYADKTPDSNIIDSDSDSLKVNRYTPLIEGMLALGFGFFALMITIAFDAQWTACGWSIQGLALVWFGRHSLRGWTVLLGLILQMLAVASLLSFFTYYNAPSPSTLSLSISALCIMASLFILRYENAPTQPSRLTSIKEQRLFHSVNTSSIIFKVLWSKSTFVSLLCFVGMVWGIIVTGIIINDYFNHVFRTLAEFIACVLLFNIIVYFVVDHYRKWNDVSIFNHGLLPLFYLSLISIAYVNFEFYTQFDSLNWPIFIVIVLGWLMVGQLWLKRWYETNQSTVFDRVFWLGAGIILIAQMANYLLPVSNNVMTVLIPSVCLIGLTYLSLTKKLMTPSWFHWQTALIGCAFLFVPLTIGWVIVSNWTHDGIVWGLPYIPVLNLYDISQLTVLGYLISTHYLSIESIKKPIMQKNLLLKVAGLLGFWILSSLLIRTLHAYASTPLWVNGAWFNEQVQTALTIAWTLTALVATIIASRSHKRFWWFMGISLLGVVVLKLVLVDLSQTDAIWRVISFLGAGSLILLIGYLAPLPPEEAEKHKNIVDDIPS